MPVAAIGHIDTDARGVASVVGTRVKVRDVVIAASSGLPPEAIRTEFPHLTLTQVFAALSHYHDHRAAVDAEIAAGLAAADAARAAGPNPHTRDQLTARCGASGVA